MGVVSGSLYRRTHSLSHLAWSWVGGRLVPFHIHQMNRVNSRIGSAFMTAQHHKHCIGYYIYYIIIIWQIHHLSFYVSDVTAVLRREPLNWSVNWMQVGMKRCDC